MALGTDGASGGRVEHEYLNFLSCVLPFSSLGLLGNKGRKSPAVGPGAGDSPGAILSAGVTFPDCY